MPGLPAYPITEVLPVNKGVDEFIAPLTISAAQAASGAFQIVLGNTPAVYSKFPYIRGITVDNTANLSAQTSFIIVADGTQQTWTIPPGGWQIIPVSGSVISLTITPITWTSGSVQFTIWNTTPPPNNVLSEFTLNGTVTIGGPVSISALGSVDITNAYVKQQIAQLEGTAFGQATTITMGTTVIPLVPNVPGVRCICQTLQIMLSFLSTSGAFVLTYGLRGAGNTGTVVQGTLAFPATTLAVPMEIYHESDLSIGDPLIGFGMEGFYTLSAAITGIEMSYFLGFYQQ